MATIKDTAATSALNEDKYINKLYDTSLDSQNKLLDQNLQENTGVLDQETQNVQQQTDENLQRIYVEAAKAAGVYSSPGTPGISGGAAAQAGLSQWNQQAADTTALKGKQNEADMEIERQRQLLASQYSAAIKQAQADNDMQRAQQLYEAAKAEDAQLLAYRKQAATLLAGKGDNSILDSIANGDTPARDTTSETWEEVLKNEEALNKVYDAQMESQRQGLLMDYQKNLSDLEAQQAQQRAQTGKNLTQTYVDALRKAKNYAEAQNAYGQGSGVQAQARLTQDTQLQKALTDLRGIQMGKDAQVGMDRFGIGQKFRDALAKANAENELKRAQALYEAAEREEQTLVDTQKFLGDQYAAQGNYSILGKLYGLTQDRIDRLQGTGAYAPSYGDGDSGSGKYGGGRDDDTPYYTGWINKYLQNMANAGIAAYEAKGNVLSSAAKKELSSPTVVRGKTSSQKYVK